MNKSKHMSNPIFKIIIKFSIFTFIIGAAILYSDKKGYFNPDESKNHTLRKWNSFYYLTSKNEKIEIMLFGNSHLYTGINPKNLSSTMEATSFILASPGTNIADSYFCIKEAVKHNKPKLIIVETYGMNNFDPYELKDGALSDQFKSFSARRDFATKLCSTPFLFSASNYFYAWSTTIRNHDYIFNNQEQLDKNKAIIENQRKTKSNKFYLGRYVRFTTGIEKNTLEMYKNNGAPVKGEEYSYSKYTELYVQKIVELCSKEGIELMFLTLPMYDEHISDYGVWENKLAEVLTQYPIKWLNLQTLPDYNGFDTYAFENTYKGNQHMTYQGSLVATYKLAEFIKDSLDISFVEKSHKWHQLFYGEEGYFENFAPIKNDKNNKIICSNKRIGNCTLKSGYLLKHNAKAKKLLIKIDRDELKGIDIENSSLRLVLRFKQNGKVQAANIDLIYDQLHQLKDYYIFSTLIKPLDNLEIVDGMVITKKK